MDEELTEQIDELTAELENEKLKNRRLRRKEYERYINTKKVMVKGATFITIVSIAAGSLLGTFLDNLKKINEGKKAISTNVYETCLDDIACNNYSDGYVFNIGSKYYEYDEIISLIRSRAEYKGISDVDLYIGVSDFVNSAMAKDVVSGLTNDDINNRAYEVYLEQELEGVKSHGR
jgi:hypothetical protein